MNIEAIQPAPLGWVVLILQPEVMRRPAVLLYDAGDGFAWVEPQAFSPDGAASTALHVRQGATVTPIDPERFDKGFLFKDTRTGEGGIVFPATDADEATDAYQELTAFYARQKTEGPDLALERERIRPQVLEMLD